MHITLTPTHGESDAQRIRLITAEQIGHDFEGSLGAAFAKTKGTLVTDPNDAAVLLLGIGDGGVRDAQFSARKLVTALRDLPQDLRIDAGILSSPTSRDASHEPLDSTLDAFKAFVRGLWLGAYQLDLWKGERPVDVLAETKIDIDGVDGGASDRDALAVAVEEARALALGQLAAMHLVDRPANAKRPMDVADYITEFGTRHGFGVEVFESEALEIQGFGGILAVGRASTHPPCLVKLTYGGVSSAHHLGLIGKGVTFDTGGISIKASKNMGFMKSDLGGAAAVLGTFVAAAELSLPVTLTGLIPLAENVIAGNAYLPSDVIRNYGGKTIEITDTDAEGRMLLADALAYLPEVATPDFTIDVATLTGSAVQTFGYECAAAFTHDDEVYRALAAVGDAIGERIWRLPLWEEYEPELKSDVADIKHYHGLPVAGAINAAKFLEYFAADKSRWMHLDIAGVAFGASGFTKDRAATGFGVALLCSYLQTFADVD